ncbi:hypothetical protein SAMN05428949_7055 [Chitinophaga sp. YR627]|uniref:hypothetical protein n=1 Tax=Chitinophaga sp. YR627 TaxID=1881041 RepID=UPI0008F43524|nr:hypothetical protein [Chitinophaga sp. YR627]SFO98025.1 hypothetical protein SAMN05428949_7055 [Chitinophaga sp. YR627]
MKLVKRSNVLLIVVTLTLFFSCKKEDKPVEPVVDPGKPAETMPDDMLLRKAVTYDYYSSGPKRTLLTDTLIYNDHNQVVKIEHLAQSSTFVFTFSYNEDGTLSTVDWKMSRDAKDTAHYALKYTNGQLDSIVATKIFYDHSATTYFKKNSQGRAIMAANIIFIKPDTLGTAQFNFSWDPTGILEATHATVYDYGGIDYQCTMFPSRQSNPASIGLKRLPSAYLFVLAHRENGYMSYFGGRTSTHLFTSNLFTSANTIFNNGSMRFYSYDIKEKKEITNYIDYENRATFDENGMLKTYKYFENTLDLYGAEFFYEQKK